VIPVENENPAPCVKAESECLAALKAERFGAGPSPIAGEAGVCARDVGARKAQGGRLAGPGRSTVYISGAAHAPIEKAVLLNRLLDLDFEPADVRQGRPDQRGAPDDAEDRQCQGPKRGWEDNARKSCWRG
jgi:hypothetical protein